MKNNSWIKILLLVLTFTVYSFSSVFSKSASMYKFLSIPYVLFFCGVVMTLIVYAILWQKVLALMSLTKAFLFKSMTIVIILTISHCIFEEVVSLQNIIGAGIITLGLIMLSWEK